MGCGEKSRAGVDNCVKLWRKCVYPEKSWKTAVDKPVENLWGYVGKLGITRGKPCEQVCNICCGDINVVRPIAAAVCMKGIPAA